jgi:uncharacterized protein (DUF2461 family)
MSRLPKGFPPGHPAEGLLRHRQWYLEAMLNLKLLTTPRLVPELAHRFEAMAPMVTFLNRALAEKPKARRMMFLGF